MQQKWRGDKQGYILRWKDRKFSFPFIPPLSPKLFLGIRPSRTKEKKNWVVYWGSPRPTPGLMSCQENSQDPAHTHTHGCALLQCRGASVKDDDAWSLKSQSPFPVKPHGTYLISSTNSYDTACERHSAREAHQRPSAQSFYWQLVAQTPSACCVPKIPDSQKDSRCPAQIIYVHLGTYELGSQDLTKSKFSEPKMPTKGPTLNAGLSRTAVPVLLCYHFSTQVALSECQLMYSPHAFLSSQAKKLKSSPHLGRHFE